MRTVAIIAIVASGCFADAPFVADAESSSSDSGTSTSETEDIPRRRRSTPSASSDGSSSESSGTTEAELDGGTSDATEETGSTSESSDDGGSICSHDPCVAGEPLWTTCDACVAMICGDYDPSCCSTWWDDGCVTQYNHHCEACQ